MKRSAYLAIAAVCASGITAPAIAAWEPVRPVEFIIPAGTGGGADQMARTIQGIVTKHNLMKQPMVVINKSGGAGGEGFLDVKASSGNPHKIIITLSNLFTTPLATGIPFNWKDLTPVAMLALDEFVLWVNADKPYKTVKDYVAAVKAAPRRIDQDGRHRFEAGRPDHHRRRRKGHRRPLHLHSVQGRRRSRRSARRQSRRFDRQQSDRGGRAMARRQTAAALRVRRTADGLYRPGRRRQELEGHPDLQVAGSRHGICHAAGHLHVAQGHQGPGRILHRSLQESSAPPRNGRNS